MVLRDEGMPLYDVIPPPGVEDEAEYMETLEAALNAEMPDDLETWLIARGLSFRPCNQKVS